jgi:drug/metabolite transporter (DMT)-like permease
MSSENKARLAMLGQTLLAGCGFTFARYALAEIHPFALALLRMMVSALVFAVIFFLRGGLQGKTLARRDWLKLFFAAALGVSLNQCFFLLGMNYTTPANGAILYAMTPMVVLLISVFVIRGETMSAQKIFGVVVALIGVAIVFISRGYEFDMASLIGNFIVLLAVICWAGYIAYGAKAMRGHDAIQGTGLMMMLGTLLFLPVGGWFLPEVAWQSISTKAWIGAAYITFASSILAYLLLTYAMNKLASSKVSIFMNAQPIVAAAFSFFVLHETLSIGFILGGLVAITGILIIQKT